MAVYYVDLTSGNDANDGSMATPWRTLEKFSSTAATGSELRIAKDATADTEVTTGDWTWTSGTTTVTVNADVTGSVAAGDWIGKGDGAGAKTFGMDGNFETLYRVNSISYSAGSGTTTIGLHRQYYGTTETVGGVWKKFYQTCTGNNATYTSVSCYINAKNFTISGGWNFTNDTRDGITTFKGNGANRTSTWYIFRFNGSCTVNISYINVLETAYFYFNVGNSGTVTSCTLSTYNHPITATANSEGPNSRHSYCVWTAESNSNGYLTNGAGTYTLNYILSNVSLINFYINAAGTNFNLTNSAVQSASVGVTTTGGGNNNIVLTNTVFRNCTTGVGTPTSNNKISGGTFTNCTQAIYSSTTDATTLFVTGCTTANNTYAVRIARTFDAVIDSLTSTSDTYGIIQEDIYGRNVRVCNCSFTTPGTTAVYSTAGQGTVAILGGSIDAPSASKLFNERTNYMFVPHNVVDGVTNAVSGQYHGLFQLVKSTGVYRTAPPALQFTAKGSYTTMNYPFKFWSTYVQASTAYTVSVYIKKAATWTGSFTPVVTLNGSVIYTGTAISSLTEDWVQYSYTITSDLVTRDGELALCFIPTSTSNISVYFDDFAIV